MRILFVTDLHGVRWKYERLFGIARDYGADAVINGGDMFPKHGDLFTEQKTFIEQFLPAHFALFAQARIHYLCFPGNDDLAVHDRLFSRVCSAHETVHSFAQARFELNGWEFIGFNLVVDYPFRLKDRCRMDTRAYQFQKQFGPGLLSSPEGFRGIPDWHAHARTLPTIEQELDGLVRPKDVRRTVYVVHMPPARLGLARCANGLEVGSEALHHFLERRQPILSLHGHIHESPRMTGVWKAQLGSTVCVQPGQEEGLTYVTVDLETMLVERLTARG